MNEQSVGQYCLLNTHARRLDLGGSSTAEAEHVVEGVHFRGLEGLMEGRKKDKMATKR
jgi:hypothetical protein